MWCSVTRLNRNPPSAAIRNAGQAVRKGPGAERGPVCRGFTGSATERAAAGDEDASGSGLDAHRPGGPERRHALPVGSEVRGRCLVFDDTLEHEAWNRSPSERIVLLLDFLR